MGGSWEYHNPGVYLLNAFGYLTNDPQGMSIALRNGKAVLPAADREAYGAYLTFMRTLYEEGLIHPDYFTMTNEYAENMVTEEKVGLFDQAAFLYTDNFGAFWGPTPLTSEYNDTPQWLNGEAMALSFGNAVITSACQEPELAAAFLDWHYIFSHMRISVKGPMEKVVPEEQWYGLEASYMDEDGVGHEPEYENHKDKYASQAEMIIKAVQLWKYQVIGYGVFSEEDCGLSIGYPYSMDDYADVENPADVRKIEKVGQKQFTLSMDATLRNYVTPGYPSAVYLDTDTGFQASDLLMGLKEYATQETAKFITGARSLDELDAYFDDMDNLGAQEYVQIYQDYYDALNG